MSGLGQVKHQRSLYMTLLNEVFIITVQYSQPSFIQTTFIQKFTFRTNFPKCPTNPYMKLLIYLKIRFPYPNLHFWTQFAISYVNKFIYPKFWTANFILRNISREIWIKWTTSNSLWGKNISGDIFYTRLKTIWITKEISPLCVL